MKMIGLSVPCRRRSKFAAQAVLVEDMMTGSSEKCPKCGSRDTLFSNRSVCFQVFYVKTVGAADCSAFATCAQRGCEGHPKGGSLGVEGRSVSSELPVQ
jgi:hypothetical protein